MRSDVVILTALAVCFAASDVWAQPVLPGQTARTQTGWTGYSVNGVSPSITTNLNDEDLVVSSSPSAHAFAATVLGGFTTFNATASATTGPAVAGFPPDGHGVQMAASTSLAVSNSRVTGSTYTASATSIFQDSFHLFDFDGPFATLEFTFTLSGSLQRSMASNLLNARVTVTAQPTGGAATTLYNTSLGGITTLGGVTIAPANPNELTRTIAAQTVTYTMIVPAGSGPLGIAFSVNAFNSFATGSNIGSGGTASATFATGLELQSLTVRDSSGVLQIPGSYDILSTSGVNYTYLLTPTPGAATFVVVGGILCAGRRRRSRA